MRYTPMADNQAKFEALAKKAMRELLEDTRRQMAKPAQPTDADKAILAERKAMKDPRKKVFNPRLRERLSKQLLANLPPVHYLSESERTKLYELVEEWHHDEVNDLQERFERLAKSARDRASKLQMIQFMAQEAMQQPDPYPGLHYGGCYVNHARCMAEEILKVVNTREPR